MAEWDFVQLNVFKILELSLKQLIGMTEQFFNTSYSA